MEQLSGLENLIQLDLSNCKVAGLENYRTKIFEIFKSLEILDNLDKEGNAINYSDDEDEDYDYDNDGGEEEEEEYDEDFDDDEIDATEFQNQEGDEEQKGGEEEEDETQLAGVPHKKVKQ